MCRTIKYSNCYAATGDSYINATPGLAVNAVGGTPSRAMKLEETLTLTAPARTQPVQRGEGPALRRAERRAPALRDSDVPGARRVGALRSDGIGSREDARPPT